MRENKKRKEKKRRGMSEPAVVGMGGVSGARVLVYVFLHTYQMHFSKTIHLLTWVGTQVGQVYSNLVSF